MKKIITLLLVSFGLHWTLQAQDVMIRKDGSEIQAKILEVNPDDVSYKRFDNPEGPVYRENKKEILKIKYANGTEDIFVKASPQNETIRKVRYSGLVELLPYFGDYSGGSGGYGGASINTTYGVQLKEKYFLGIGTGINSSEYHTYIPLYATFGMDFSREKIHPFFTLSLGPQFRSSKNYYFEDVSGSSVALWSNAMFGYRFKSFYTASGISIQTGYNYEYDYNYNLSRYRRENYGAVCFTLAFGFKW